MEAEQVLELKRQRERLWWAHHAFGFTLGVAVTAVTNSPPAFLVALAFMVAFSIIGQGLGYKRREIEEAKERYAW